ncbi:nucleotide pyrophosphohydrolase [Candidatus Gracilibacteria bacterium CG17_big_fil_post_rev_8_21_14_2_50_48_13]|nr:MAG: nucleotide pyrophosphohydrolase [Candidatus Gracilibacteria bacterium CG17_big_fil_post_rev_8_21_14_2_50_48_13]
MEKLTQLRNQILDFRKKRDWEQFHNPKDLALSLVLEATEVLEHFQWKNGDQIDEYVNTHTQEIAEELADVLYWVILMSSDLNIDILDALEQKIEKNNRKYPVEKSKGVSTKYTKL